MKYFIVQFPDEADTSTLVEGAEVSVGGVDGGIIILTAKGQTPPPAAPALHTHEAETAIIIGPPII